MATSSVPWWRLRQVALVADDLDAAEQRVNEVLGVGPCWSDPGVAEFGLVNALWAVGDTFLEVVSPARPDTSAGRYLQRRGGDSGYMAILQTDDLDGARARVAAAGVRVVTEAAADGVTGLHLHPRDMGGAIVSVDRCDDPADWPWAGPDWSGAVDRSRVAEITAVEVAVTDPGATAARWAAIVGLPRRRPRTLGLATGRVEFVEAEARGAGEATGAVVAVEVRASDQMLAGTAHDVVGVELRFV